jgi:hypothetical protein
MTRTRIFTAYVAIDLLIVVGVVWCVFEKMPVSKYLIPAMVLFTLNGLVLLVLTIRNTPQRPPSE